MPPLRPPSNSGPARSAPPPEIGQRSGTTGFLPSTFAERGVAVSFTTPVLNQSRVRKTERETLELLIPGLAANKGIYVVNWKGVPSVCTMTLHDRMLHAKILEQGETSPLGIRACTLEVARKGLAGAAVARAAKQAVAREEEERMLSVFFLLSATLQRLAGADAAIEMRDLATERGRAQAKRALTKAAGGMDLSADELYDRLEEWGTMIAPLGVSGGMSGGMSGGKSGQPMDCRLTRMTRDLEQFSTQLRDWSREEQSDAADAAQLIAEVAEDTVLVGKSFVAASARFVEHLETTLRKWRSGRAALEEQIRKASWIFDGWDAQIAGWHHASTCPREEQRRTLRQAVHFVPPVPRKEMRADMSARYEGFEQRMHRAVRPMEDWLSGDFDLDFVQRAEKIKQKAL